jgi:uncharacterized membrane protein
MAARRESQRLRRAARGRGEAEQEASTAVEEQRGGEPEENGDKEHGGLFSELKDVVSDAALSVLAPVAKQMATKAAKAAVKKGPELVEDKLMPMLADAGGPAGLLDSAKDLIPGADGGEDGDGDAGDGTGKGRRMPIQQAVDVAAPIDVVYDQFTLFEDWPKFMHRVERVEQKDEATVVFHEKIWAWRRQWEAEIVEQFPDERIVWESVSGMQHVGVVTFHELAERLTRIELNIDIDPSGPIEKIARGARFAKRAARADLKRFKAYVEMHDEDPDGWRGEIEDGDVTGYEDEEPRDEAEVEEPEAEVEEPEVEEAEEPEPEEKPKPKRRQPSRSRSSNGSSKSTSSSSSRSRSKPSSGSRSKSSGSRSKSSSSRSKSGGSRSRGSSNGSSGRSSSKTRSKSSSSR